MARVGKIARLPHIIRSQLNERIRDGQDGQEILDWLNALPPTRQMLETWFDGAPVTPQNLSEWRQGGYPEWLRQQEALEIALDLTEHADDLEVQTDEADLTANLANVLLIQLARASKDLLTSDASPQERWNHLRELLPALNDLRRAKTHADRQRILEERWIVESADCDTSETPRAVRRDVWDHEMAVLHRQLTSYQTPPPAPEPTTNQDETEPDET